MSATTSADSNGGDLMRNGSFEYCCLFMAANKLSIDFQNHFYRSLKLTGWLRIAYNRRRLNGIIIAMLALQTLRS